MKTGKSRSLSPCPTWHPWPRRAGIFSKQNQAPHGIWRERKSSRPSLRAHAINRPYRACSRGASIPTIERLKENGGPSRPAPTKGFSAHHLLKEEIPNEHLLYPLSQFSNTFATPISPNWFRCEAKLRRLAVGRAPAARRAIRAWRSNRDQTR